MKIVVCIKQVPDTTEVKIDPVTNTLKREGVPSIINPFDEYAIEEGVRIKERIGNDATVTVITMGPPQAESALREAISRGADEAILELHSRLECHEIPDLDTMFGGFFCLCGSYVQADFHVVILSFVFTHLTAVHMNRSLSVQQATVHSFALLCKDCTSFPLDRVPGITT